MKMKNISVCDCGCGNNPMQQATVLFDKFIYDDRHRRGKLKLFDGVPFVEGDVEDMGMFVDDEFDFVNATHILEHTDNPILALGELVRVGKSGYAEVPSFIAERMLFGSVEHRWAVLSVFGRVAFVMSVRHETSHAPFRFKVARAVDFLFNTCHTRIFWGHGRVIKYSLKMQSTNSILRKLEVFASMTCGVATQYVINLLISMLISKGRVLE